MSESNEEVYTIPDYMRMHPSMCYGKLGDGTGYFDCIYLMLQAIIDNSIDEFKMGFGDRIEVAVDYATGEMCVRDYGRGAPVEKLYDCFIAHDGGGMYSADFTMNHTVPWASAVKVSALSEGFLVQSVCTGKYGRLVVRHGKKVSHDMGECSAVFMMDHAVPWTSAVKVSTLSEDFLVQSVCNGEYGRLEVCHGKKVSYDMGECGAGEKNGMLVRWTPDTTVLPAFTIVEEHVVLRIKECAAANPGLKFFLNGKEITAV